MKQAFGIFTAILLMPAFQVQAWIGGPWSNNSHQTNGDDGIYEAVGTMTDGIAMYRWAVQNENPGGINLIGIPAPTAVSPATTSNVQFGGLVGAASPHVIYYRGIVYYGRCFGIVSSQMRKVSVIGNASHNGVLGPPDPGQDVINGVVIRNSLVFADVKSVANSAFRGRLSQRGPMKRFSAKGQVMFVGGGVPQGATQFLQHGHKVAMRVFGAQVSLQPTG